MASERQKFSGHTAERTCARVWCDQLTSVRGGGEAGGSFDPELGQAVDEVADEVVDHPLLPLRPVAPWTLLDAVLALPADESVERLVGVPEMTLERFVEDRTLSSSPRSAISDPNPLAMCRASSDWMDNMTDAKALSPAIIPACGVATRRIVGEGGLEHDVERHDAVQRVTCVEGTPPPPPELGDGDQAAGVLVDQGCARSHP